jgi:hypothetical protein
VAKFTSPAPLSLLILCKLSFPIVGSKVSFLPVLALKSPNRILCVIQGVYQKVRYITVNIMHFLSEIIVTPTGSVRKLSLQCFWAYKYVT